MDRLGPRNYRLQVRVTPTMRKQLRTEAEARGLKPTELVRFLVVDFLDHRSRAREEQAEVQGKADHAGKGAGVSGVKHV